MTIEYDPQWTTKVGLCRVSLSANCRYCQANLDRFYFRALNVGVNERLVELMHWDDGDWVECEDQTAESITSVL